MAPEVIEVSKSTITKIFVGGLIALAGGVVILFAAIGLAYANDSFVMSGPDVTGIRSTPFSWTMIGVAMLAILVMVAGAVAQFVAWLAAVLNTARLEDKTWFILLLVTGLASFGLLGTIVYLLAGPGDAAPAQPRRQAPVTPAHV